MSNKDKDFASSNKTKTKKLTAKNNKPAHKNTDHDKNTHSTPATKQKEKEVFSKDNLSVNKDSNYDKDKTFPSEHKDKTKKTDSEIEFNTYHGEDENFISALKNKAKELAS